MKRKTIYYTLATTLMSLLLILGMSITVFAATATDLDLNKTGSISLTMKNSSGTAVSGGNLTIYRVAQITKDNANLAYTPTSDFASFTKPLDNLEDANLAKELADYTKKQSLTGTTTTIGSSGIAKFENLALGLYLVVQPKAADNYNAVNPFLVSVPLQEDGIWVYDVDASPKVEAYIKTPTNPTTPTTATPIIPTTPGKLPQTGQLNWPIPILAISGLLLFTLGWSLTFIEKKQPKVS